jgi:hypothetical protein
MLQPNGEIWLLGNQKKTHIFSHFEKKEKTQTG